MFQLNLDCPTIFLNIDVKCPGNEKQVRQPNIFSFVAKDGKINDENLLLQFYLLIKENYHENTKRFTKSKSFQKFVGAVKVETKSKQIHKVEKSYIFQKFVGAILEFGERS